MTVSIRRLSIFLSILVAASTTLAAEDVSLWFYDIEGVQVPFKTVSRDTKLMLTELSADDPASGLIKTSETFDLARGYYKLAVDVSGFRTIVHVFQVLGDPVVLRVGLDNLMFASELKIRSDRDISGRDLWVIVCPLVDNGAPVHRISLRNRQVTSPPLHGGPYVVSLFDGTSLLQTVSFSFPNRGDVVLVSDSVNVTLAHHLDTAGGVE